MSFDTLDDCMVGDIVIASASAPAKQKSALKTKGIPKLFSLLKQVYSEVLVSTALARDGTEFELRKLNSKSLLQGPYQQPHLLLL